jgi:hypothetical protein
MNIQRTDNDNCDWPEGGKNKEDWFVKRSVSSAIDTATAIANQRE